MVFSSWYWYERARPYVGIKIRAFCEVRWNELQGAVGVLNGWVIWHKSPKNLLKTSFAIIALLKSMKYFARGLFMPRDVYFGLTCMVRQRLTTFWLYEAQAWATIFKFVFLLNLFILKDSYFNCTSKIAPGSDDDFNLEQSSLRNKIDISFGGLICSAFEGFTASIRNPIRKSCSRVW